MDFGMYCIYYRKRDEGFIMNTNVLYYVNHSLRVLSSSDFLLPNTDAQHSPAAHATKAKN